MRVDGSCFCGNLTFEAEVDPTTVILCHCTDCQILSSSAFRIIVPAIEGSFRLLSGRPTIYVKTAESGNRRAQAFCPDCGSRLWAAAEKDPQFFNLRLGGVRQRAQLAPKSQVWCSSSLPWSMNLGAVKQYPKQAG